MVDLIKKIFVFLPDEVSNNLCFKQVKEKVLEKITSDDDVELFVSEDILKRVEGYQKFSNVSPLIGDTKLIFSLDVRDDELSLSIINNKFFTVQLSTCLENNGVYEENNSEIMIKDGLTYFKLISVVFNEDSYYLDYSSELYCYNKNFDMVEIPDLDDVLDQSFIGFFNVDESKARDCRLNFKENIHYINSCKVKSIMKTIDETFIDKGISFSSVVETSNMFDVVLCGDNEVLDDEFEDDLNEEDDQDVAKNDFLEERIQVLEDMLFSYFGYDGKFVLSYNLVLNIRSYLSGEFPLIFTNGIVVRKLNDEFTVFNVYLSHDNLIVMHKDITKAEARELFYSCDENLEKDGLDEFFDIINQKRKDI